jgi:hypothetical protein
MEIRQGTVFGPAPIRIARPLGARLCLRMVIYLIELEGNCVASTWMRMHFCGSGRLVHVEGIY